MQRNATQCNAMQRNAIQRNTMSVLFVVSEHLFTILLLYHKEIDVFWYIMQCNAMENSIELHAICDNIHKKAKKPSDVYRTAALIRSETVPSWMYLLVKKWQANVGHSYDDLWVCTILSTLHMLRLWWFLPRYEALLIFKNIYWTFEINDRSQAHTKCPQIHDIRCNRKPATDDFPKVTLINKANLRMCSYSIFNGVVSVSQKT